MSNRAFIVTGLGFGDEGKGTVTHSLACEHKAHTVIRTGGAQALHRVVTKRGQSHVFSQFGSGTFRGSATHLSKHMVIDPNAILVEGEALRYESGIRGIFEMMTIHEDALVISPFQALAGRVRELLRGKSRLGSVGIGIGETVLDAEALKGDALRAKDLGSRKLREKLEVIRAHKWAEFEAFADRASKLPKESEVLIRQQLAMMANPDTLQWALEKFSELGRRVRIVDSSYVAERILGHEGTVVFEGSQGVLLDRWQGFHPFTTKVRTTPEPALNILRESGYRGETKSLGVLRAYHTRHGGGPFISESPELTAELPDAANKTHAWQGNFRVGHFDMVAARYAIDACKDMLDGIVLTCLDRLRPRGFMQMCTGYELARIMRVPECHFSFEEGTIARIKAHPEGSGPVHLKRQERITRVLEGCSPRLRTLSLYEKDSETKLKGVLEESLALPLVGLSKGETEADKFYM